VAGGGAEPVIDVRNAYTMVSMLQDVVKHGTAFRAMELGRQDLAGKTGTTNDSLDACFAASIRPWPASRGWATISRNSLGDRETAGRGLADLDELYGQDTQWRPAGHLQKCRTNMVAVHINEDGYRDENADRIEYFYKENVPSEQAMPLPTEEAKPTDVIKDQLL